MKKELTKEDVLQAIKIIRESDYDDHYNLELTLKPDKAGHIYCLLEMNNNGSIRIRGMPFNRPILTEIMNSYNWGNEKNRTIEIFLRFNNFSRRDTNFNEKIFVDRMYDALEKIAIVSHLLATS